MNKIEDTFNDDYMQKRLYIAWRAPIVCAAIQKVFNPESVVDCGCSVGDLVKGFNDLGIEAHGIDGSSCVIPHYLASPDTLRIIDLRKKIANNIKADLCTCFETYSIFEVEHKKMLLKNLTRISKRVLIGVHEECRDEVILEMRRLNYLYEFPNSATMTLQAELEPWKSKPAIKAIYHTAMYFEKA